MAKTIIVPLDGSEFAERALTPAAALAKRTGAQVIVMTSQRGGVIVEPKHYLADVAAQAGITGPEVAVIPDRSVVTGLQKMVAEVADPLVCMSTHGYSRLLHAVLGSKAEEAIRQLRAPMLLIGPHVDPDLAVRFESVVVCTDGTPMSRAIVPEVSQWIQALRLQTRVVQVLNRDARRALEERRDDPAVEVSVAQALAQSLPTRDAADVNWNVLHSDHTAHALVDNARDVLASLIAMATHGRTGLARLALGSVAAAVVHDAPCPVLVVRPDSLVDGARAGDAQTEENAAAPRRRCGR